MHKLILLLFTVVSLGLNAQIEISFEDDILPTQFSLRKSSEKKMQVTEITNPIVIEASNEPTIILINDVEMVLPSSSSKLEISIHTHFPIESISIPSLPEWANTIRIKNSIVESLKYKSILLDTGQYISVLEQEWSVYEKLLNTLRSNENLKTAVDFELEWMAAQKENRWKKQLYRMGVNYRRLSFQQRMRAVWGTQAINITAQDEYDEIYDLESLKGKPIIIDFWATWCGPCKAEVPFINALNQKYGNQVHFVSLGVKSPFDKWNTMKNELNLEYNWFIPKDKMSQVDSWEVYFIPRYMVIDKDFNVYLTDAPKPSSGELESVIQDLLNVD